MGKITVKHYLNKAIKPRIEGNKELYPLYIQLIANRTNFRFKSNFPFNDGYLRESDLLQDFVGKSIEREKFLIEKIATFLIESNENGLLTAEYIKKCSEYLWDVLNINFGILFENEGIRLKCGYPDALVGKNYFDIDGIISFTRSEIENSFSEEYQYCKTGMDAIKRSLFDSEKQNLNISQMTVFDFIHGTGKEQILQAVKLNHVIHGGDEETEYQKVINEIEKLISTE